MTALERNQLRFTVMSLVPPLMLFTFWIALPSAKAFYFALTKWDGLSEPEFIGPGHLASIATLQDPLVQTAVKNNLILMVVPAMLILSLALFFASVIRSGLRGGSLFRVTFFFPNILSAVAISVLWMLLYSTSGFGVFNNFLEWFNQSLIGLGARSEPLLKVPFAFTDSSILVWSIVPMMVWTATGFYMLLFFASMQSIPESLYEAARVDGASTFSQFWHITLPMIRDTVVTGLVFLIIAGLKIFDQIWVIEQQQARPDSNTLTTLMYSKIFTEYRVGYGTAIAVVLFLVILGFTLATFKLYRKEALEY